MCIYARKEGGVHLCYYCCALDSLQVEVWLVNTEDMQLVNNPNQDTPARHSSANRNTFNQ